MVTRKTIRGWQFGLAALFLVGGAGWSQDGKSPVKVTMEAAKDERFEAEAPVDATPRIQFRNFGNTFTLNINDEMGRRLHLGHFPVFKIDGMVMNAGGVPGGRFEINNGPLPKKGEKVRPGYMNVWVKDNLRLTQIVEVVPTKSFEGGKRRMDAVVVRYTVENKGTTPHTVGMRTTIDSFVVTNRNCKFAAPNRPGKLLEAMEFKEARDIPAYVQVLQQPDLKNPGTTAWVTFAVGSGIEKPERVVLTSNLGRRDVWDLAVQGGGVNTLIGFFWEPKEIKPGTKREMAYGYGLGHASGSGIDSNFHVDLSGSFEQGKTFTISAVVTDPIEGQTLELELPKGLERIEGRQIQPVPLGLGEEAASMVLWKGRVQEYGRFPVTIRSSSGVAKTTILTIAPSGG